MDRVRLGRTSLDVSVACLGTGGHSRLGQARGADTASSVAVVRAALDEGVDIIDTAGQYGTETIVGAAVAGRRDTVTLSTKSRIHREGTPHLGTDLVGGAEIIAQVERSLRRLRTDRIDVLHLHGVAPGQYDHCVSELLPVLHRLRDEGKIRFLGISERFTADTGHTTSPPCSGALSRRRR